MTIHALGPFRLDTDNDLLFRGGELVALGRRAIALLRALVERPGAPVAKVALIEAAWPGQAVEDSNLTVQIAALRRVLGQEPGGDRWIETLPRRGYRFVGPLTAKGENGVPETPPQIDAAPGTAPTPDDIAERRQITALSCELIGTERPAEGVDLEKLREAVGAFRRCISDTVGRYNGFVSSYFGNSVLVVFGYPTAQEHDAEQAVRAGLELCVAVRGLQPEAKVPMRCRVGIATGTVIIGNSGGGGKLSQHEIVGDVPHSADRLRASVQPDKVAIEPVTRRLICNLFDCRDLGAIDTSAAGEPMRGWQVLRESLLASRFEALRGSPLTRLVGRDEETDLLLRRWARAKAGDGQVVLISGEPGLGKSRITAALEERLDAEQHLCLRYYCSPYHQDSALFPFIDQLARGAGFARDDPAASRLEKLEVLLASAASPDEDVGLLADLMSLPTSNNHSLPNLSPQRKKERTLNALIRQIEGLTRRQPLVIVFEDVHWVDPTSRELLDLTVVRVRTLPVLLIVTFRPEFQSPWTGQPQVTMLALNRLDRRDRTAMVVEVAGGKALPAAVVDQIADRTDGVPLFIEELTKSVLESGMLREETDRYMLDGALPPFAVPTSLHASLVARLDRLASVRHVAQVGSAIGREFSYDLIYAVSRLFEDELQVALGRLVASELVFQRGTPPDAIYSFKHALVQDVAHNSLLRRTRQQLHARIAEVLTANSPEIIDSQPELLAQHYVEAGLIEKSVLYWGKAGRRSAARSATAEAAAQLQKGLDQLELLPETPERQRQELELRSGLAAALMVVRGFAAPETGDAYARARALWEQLGSPSELLHIPWGQSHYHAVRDELDRAQTLAEDLLGLSRQRNDAAGLVLGHYSLGRTFMYMGRFARSRSHLEKALTLYDPISHRSLVHQTGLDPRTISQASLGLVLFFLGFPDQASAQSSASVVEGGRLAHPPSLSLVLSYNALLLLLAGDDAALEERANQLVAVTAEQRFPLYHATGMIYLGWVKVRNGDVTEGVAVLRSGLAAYRATRAESWVTNYIALLAVAYEIAGQVEEALAQFDHALQVVERTGQRWFEAELNRHKGQLLLRRGHTEAAEELYRKALSIARKQGAKLWELRAAVSLARLRRDQGRRGEAQAILAPVHAWSTEGFDTADLKDAKALLDGLA
ncbi:MAG TPA: AAA family ATPase [Xanthobacteraceae bacterium]